MGISGVDRVSLHPGAAWRLPWHLRPGQMVLVEMLAGTGPEAVVRIAGQTFNARGELPNSPAVFWAMIEEIREQTLHLRRLSPEITADLSPEDLARLLELPVDKDTVQLVKEMLRRGLPLDRRAIMRLLTEGRALPEAERESFWAARLYLETLDLREDAEKVRRAADYLMRRNEAGLRDLSAGQEALNRAQALDPSQDVLRFFLFLGAESFGEVYLIQRNNGGGEQELPVGLVVQVTTLVLGETWVYLSQESTANYSLKIAVTDERFLTPATEMARALQEKLTAIGYRVNTVSVAACPAKTVFDVIEPAETANYRALDAMV
ncbi:MAG: hypothetical protein AB1426_01925 [Bacillota bacterium]